MKKFFVVLFVLLGLGLTGCSAQYTEKQITAYLDRSYGSTERFLPDQTITDGEYRYYDQERDVDFLVETKHYGWGENSIFPFLHRAIYPHLNDAIILKYKKEATKLAEGYGVSLEDGQRIYVVTYAQLENAAKLVFDLADLYQLELEGEAKRQYISIECAAPAGEPVFIHSVDYAQLVDGQGHLYLKDDQQLLAILQEKWRSVEEWNSSLPASKSNKMT